MFGSCFMLPPKNVVQIVPVKENFLEEVLLHSRGGGEGCELQSVAHSFWWVSPQGSVASLLLVELPFVPSSYLLLVARMLLVVMPFVTTSILCS